MPKARRGRKSALGTVYSTREDPTPRVAPGAISIKDCDNVTVMHGIAQDTSRQFRRGLWNSQQSPPSASGTGQPPPSASLKTHERDPKTGHQQVLPPPEEQNETALDTARYLFETDFSQADMDLILSVLKPYQIHRQIKSIKEAHVGLQPHEMAQKLLNLFGYAISEAQRFFKGKVNLLEQRQANWLDQYVIFKKRFEEDEEKIKRVQKQADEQSAMEIGK